jgi:hypothetical protein
MNETQVNYRGRIVDKKHFRAFIHGATGDKKLVENWAEFEKHMATGLWFDAEEKIKELTIEAPKKRVTRKPKNVEEIDTISLAELLSLPTEAP